MRVYNACFQVIRKRLPALMIYIAVFLTIALMLTNFNKDGGQTNFTSEKTNVVLFNDDGGSAISAGLKQYLSQHAVLVSVQDDKRTLQDALFFYKADSILRIPSGFSKALTSGTAQISRSSRADSTNSIYTDYLVNRYLNLANLYAKSLPGLSEAQIAAKVSATLKNQSTIQMRTFGQKAQTSGAAYYYNYLVYAIIAVLILSTSSVLFTFQKIDLRRRNLCAPMSALSSSLQQLFAILTFGVLVWAVFGGLGMVIEKDSLNVHSSVLYLCNAFAMMLVGLGLGFLVSSVVKSEQAASAASNVFSLGMCFLCGIFVPQEYMSSSVLHFAQFLPAYWYVRATKTIDSLSSYTFSNITPVFQCIGIELGFAAALVLIGLLIYRQKQTSST